MGLMIQGTKRSYESQKYLKRTFESLGFLINLISFLSLSSVLCKEGHLKNSRIKTSLFLLDGTIDPSSKTSGSLEYCLFSHWQRNGQFPNLNKIDLVSEMVILKRWWNFFYEKETWLNFMGRYSQSHSY